MSGRPGTVGVVIPTFNRPDLVMLAVASVQAQQRPADRIVVVDDGGSTPMPDALRALESAGRVTLLRVANGGTAHARNAGAAIIDTEYLLFLDDDDTLYPDALAGLATILDAHPTATAAAGGGRRRFGDAPPRPPEWPCTEPLDFETLMRGNALFSSGTMVRRDAFVRVGGYEAAIPVAEDWDLWLKLAQLGPIMPSETVAVEYYVHGGNATKSSKVPRMAITLVMHYWPRLAPDVRHRVGPALSTYLIGHYARDLGWYSLRSARRGKLADASREFSALGQLTWLALRHSAGRRAIWQEIRAISR
ncbi:MAG: glycosyltransferase family 2 protein [Gemmatimonadales bacterium]|nr:glycosyltransferase family 2 protein [Gemmatimonadales bacterium]MBP6570533.1 glycosyltransferase family 2 protein [Gemmatimonadales bacterium]MBP7619870.1 glycosyltransferase family 2 protein [Gemmatimonadales bacterium]MBP9897899.1 glycosyltransferase family 2 protein [Gemmatimonadales bacterium]